MARKAGKKKSTGGGGRGTGPSKRPARKTPILRFAEEVTKILRFAEEVTKRVPAYRVEQVELEEVVGSVWCDVHGCIHDETNDPYSYGYEESGETPECDTTYWRKLYMPPMKD